MNERLDFASLAMGLKEGLGQASAAAAPHDARALALERSLLARESELEYLQHALQVSAGDGRGLREEGTGGWFRLRNGVME